VEEEAEEEEEEERRGRGAGGRGRGNLALDAATGAYASSPLPIMCEGRSDTARARLLHGCAYGRKVRAPQSGTPGNARDSHAEPSSACGTEVPQKTDLLIGSQRHPGWQGRESRPRGARGVAGFARKGEKAGQEPTALPATEGTENLVRSKAKQQEWLAGRSPRRRHPAGRLHEGAGDRRPREMWSSTEPAYRPALFSGMKRQWP